MITRCFNATLVDVGTYAVDFGVTFVAATIVIAFQVNAVGVFITLVVASRAFVYVLALVCTVEVASLFDAACVAISQVETSFTELTRCPVARISMTARVNWSFTVFANAITCIAIDLAYNAVQCNISSTTC